MMTSSYSWMPPDPRQLMRWASESLENKDQAVVAHLREHPDRIAVAVHHHVDGHEFSREMYFRTEEAAVAYLNSGAGLGERCVYVVHGTEDPGQPARVSAVYRPATTGDDW